MENSYFMLNIYINLMRLFNLWFIVSRDLLSLIYGKMLNLDN